MRLRLSQRGEAILDGWRDRQHPSEHDQALVAGVLRDVADKKWQDRWYGWTDPADTSITIIEPRPGLQLRLRLWTENEDKFELVSIIHEAPPFEDQ